MLAAAVMFRRLASTTVLVVGLATDSMRLGCRLPMAGCSARIIPSGDSYGRPDMRNFGWPA